MDEFGCDYECRTVEEGMNKYNVCDDWWVEFDVYDDFYPLICIRPEEIRKIERMMTLKIRVVENEDEEYAGCMVFPEEKRITFKIDYMQDLIEAMKL